MATCICSTNASHSQMGFANFIFSQAYPRIPVSYNGKKLKLRMCTSVVHVRTANLSVTHSHSSQSEFQQMKWSKRKNQPCESSHDKYKNRQQDMGLFLHWIDTFADPPAVLAADSRNWTTHKSFNTERICLNFNMWVTSKHYRYAAAGINTDFYIN